MPTAKAASRSRRRDNIVRIFGMLLIKGDSMNGWAICRTTRRCSYSCVRFNDLKKSSEKLKKKKVAMKKGGGKLINERLKKEEERERGRREEREWVERKNSK